MSIKQQHQLEVPNSHLLSIEVYIQQDDLGAEVLALPAQKSIEQQHQPERLNSSLFSNEIYIQQEQQEEVDAEVLALPVQKNTEQQHQPEASSSSLFSNEIYVQREQVSEEVLALPVDSSEKQPHAVKNDKNERKKQEVIDKLTTLTKKYLTHLNTASRKNNDNLTQRKHTIISKLDNILSDTSLDRNEKLHLFSAHFRTADKDLLKNHREPNWVAFKKVALFFLSLTGIGAIFGVIDYSIRRHHSIFCTPKSHGERFVLDIENIRNP
ncbi:hypothetical protein [Legionella fairfieldensis]|uniref:hypothetical protein n=1 Tax=Legionella fairfieldensis TaxID=45064 RepID=UPI00049181E4|nr:hypothetical protein [Legionella fairfieldensis]